MADFARRCSLEAGQPATRQESSLRHQTRVVRASPDGAGFAVGSVEGRVALEYFHPVRISSSSPCCISCAALGSQLTFCDN